jgi:hypothetical protein
MFTTRKIKKGILIVVMDILQFVQSFMLSMLLVHIALVDNIEDVIHINIYGVICLYLLASGVKIVLIPLSKGNT